jgi:hypothetical protein
LATLISIGALCGVTNVSASSESTFRFPTNTSDFDSRSLMIPGSSSASSFSLVNPDRFSMRQSYSLSAMSSGSGSASAGTYLNTLGYQISEPLFFFVDVGFHTPIHSSMQGVNASQAGAAGSSMILPRMGLEYRPSERMSFNLELVNLQDAWKAGYGMGSSSFYGSRFP